MSPLRPHTAWLGIISGLLLYVTALLPGSHAYPFLWPLVGGAVAMWLATRRGAEHSDGVATLKIGLTVGLIAATVAAAATLPTYILLTSSIGTPLARAMGSSGPLPWSPRALETLVIALLLAIPAALLGSIVSRPLSRRVLA